MVDPRMLYHVSPSFITVVFIGGVDTTVNAAVGAVITAFLKVMNVEFVPSSAVQKHRTDDAPMIASMT
ncbi:MAG: hypothetical protein QM323_08085 [Acidobacteriota bacterium]|nr:hypothetical protein [Acidobacteriota bacterium]